MELKQDLGTKLINGHWFRIGLFFCIFCKQEVEKEIRNGKRNKSCGCVWHSENKGDYKHGGYGTRLYRIHHSMKQRCLNFKDSHFKDYGGRGITICPEWTDKLNGFINFRNWALNNGYADNLQINRIINDGNYCPKNCEWSTHEENSRNRRNTKLTLSKANIIRKLFKSGDYTKTELARKYNVNRITIHNIINNIIWRNI